MARHRLEKPDARCDLTGQTFGRLHVIKFDHWHTLPCGLRKAKYWCRCKCGEEVVVFGTHLVTGQTKSCGCFRRERAQLSYGEAARHALWYRYQYDAKMREHSWGLSEDVFHTITKCNCHYCHLRGIETPPKQIYSHPGYYGEYTYNGIDRVDSEVGYFKWNCVPCCGDCNRGKGSMDVFEFEKRIGEQKKIKL